jgi:hypothetical protein
MEWHTLILADEEQLLQPQMRTQEKGRSGTDHKSIAYNVKT